MNLQVNIHVPKRFKDCVKAFVDYGLKFNDEILLSVLLDDATSLEN